MAVGPPLDVVVPSGRSLAIDGAAAGAQRPVLDGGGVEQVLRFGGAGRVSLSNLVIADGLDVVTGEGGGGIYTTIQTGLFGVTVRDNAGGSWRGGGIHATALLSIYDSEFYGNSAREGGGIWSTGWTVILRSHFHDNNSQYGAAMNIQAPLDLADSLVEGNTALVLGGGIHCLCSRADVIRTSFIDNRTSSSEGGAMYADSPPPGGVPFTITLADVAMFQNRASTLGGGLFVGDGGTSVLNSVSIYDNDSQFGPALRLSTSIGGSTNTITNSIVWGNEHEVPGVLPDDCATFDYETGGTASIIGAGGCVPLGGGTRIDVDPGITGPGQFGGGTSVGPAYVEPTVLAIDGSSPALDAGICPAADVDARFLPRPTPACDLGAFELTLAAGQFRDDGDGTFGTDTTTLDFGSVHVPLDRLPGSVLSDPSGNGSLDQPGTVSQAQIRGIDLEQTGLAAVPLRQIALDAIALDAELLASITLDQIPLDYSSTNGQGWKAYLLDFVSSLADQPLNTVTFDKVLAATANNPAADIDVGQIDLSATPLGSLPVGAMALGGTSLADIAASGDVQPVDWCALIAPYTTRTCGPGAQIDPSTATLVSISLQGVPLRQIPLRQIPLRQIDLSAAPLRQIPLRQIDIEASPLRQIPLRQIDMVASPLRQIPLRQIDIQGSPLRQIPLRQIPLRQIDLNPSPLRQIPLRQINLETSPLRQIPLRQIDMQVSPLRQIPLRQIAGISAIVDCTQFTQCASQTLTLADVPAQFLIGNLGALAASVPANVSLGTLGEIVDTIPPDGRRSAPSARSVGPIILTPTARRAMPSSQFSASWRRCSARRHSARSAGPASPTPTAR